MIGGQRLPFRIVSDIHAYARVVTTWTAGVVVGIELIWLIEYTGSFEFLRYLLGVRVGLLMVSGYYSLLEDRLTSSSTVVKTSEMGESFGSRFIRYLTHI